MSLQSVLKWMLSEVSAAFEEVRSWAIAEFLDVETALETQFKLELKNGTHRMYLGVRDAFNQMVVAVEEEMSGKDGKKFKWPAAMERITDILEHQGMKFSQGFRDGMLQGSVDLLKAGLLALKEDKEK